MEFAIRMSFNNINKYGMERAKKSVKLLSENEMETLNRYGLQLKLISNDIIRLEKSINEKSKKEKEKGEKLNELKILTKITFLLYLFQKIIILPN